MNQTQHAIPLEAKSPFELRVNLSAGMPETDVRTALATGEMGFLHSFTTGSTVDGPGVRVVGWTTGCQFRCLYCHNPDTWNMSNGIPVPLARATEELRKYRQGLKVMLGGFTLSGGEPLMQDRFVVKLLAAAKGLGIHTALDTNGALGARLSDADLEHVDLVLLDLKAGTQNFIAGLLGWRLGQFWILPVAWLLAEYRSGCGSCSFLGLLTMLRTLPRLQGFPPTSETCNESTYCPSIKWAGSNGRSSNLTTPLKKSRLRVPRQSKLPARSFVRLA